MAQRAADRAARLSDTRAAKYERFLNDFQVDRYRAETSDNFFVPKDEIVESHVYWDGEGEARS